MNKELPAYFSSPDFQEILKKYLDMIDNHIQVYFDSDDLMDLAFYFIETNNEKEAEKVLDYALQLRPDDTNALIFKIRDIANRGMYDKALQLLAQIEDQTNEEVIFMKAEILIETGKQEEADAILQKMVLHQDDSVKLLSDIAIFYLELGNSEYAYKWINAIKEKGQTLQNSQILRDLWTDYSVLVGNFNDAIATLKITLDEHPYSLEHWVQLSKYHLANEEVPQALEASEFALAINVKSKEANELKAICYINQKEYQKAIDHINNSLKHIKDKTDRMYGLLANCYVEIGQLEEAIHEFKLWIENVDCSDMEKAEIHNTISVCYQCLDDMENAMYYIDKAMEIDPQNPRILIQRAYYYIHDGIVDEAERVIDEALSYCDDQSKEYFYFNIANNYYTYCHHDKSIEWCQKGLQEYPDATHKYSALAALCYIKMDNRDIALEYLIKAFDFKEATYPGNPIEKERMIKYMKELKNDYSDIDDEEIIKYICNL